MPACRPGDSNRDESARHGAGPTDSGDQFALRHCGVYIATSYSGERTLCNGPIHDCGNKNHFAGTAIAVAG